MASLEWVKLARDCEVVQIPEGLKVRLARGTPVRIMQTLGGMFTVQTEYGNLVRIADVDADALGLENISQNTQTAAAENLSADQLRDRVWSALRNVFDPEIPVNVVDLGLVYKNEVTPLPEGGHGVDVDMTLTAPGCGMGNVLKEDAERRIRSLPTVKTVQVNIVVDPPWDQSKMSESAKLELGLF